MNRRSLRVAALAMLVMTVLVVPSCSKGIDGKYVSTAGIITIEFKSGKATISGMGETETVDYKVDGDKIILTKKGEKEPLVLTRMQDGTLEGMMMTFKKAAS